MTPPRAVAALIAVVLVGHADRVGARPDTATKRRPATTRAPATTAANSGSAKSGKAKSGPAKSGAASKSGPSTSAARSGAVTIVLHADAAGRPGTAVDGYRTADRVHRVTAVVRGTKAKRFRWAFRAVTTLGGDDIDLGGSGNVIGDLTEVVGAVEFPQGAPEGTYRVDLYLDSARVATRTYDVRAATA